MQTSRKIRILIKAVAVVTTLIATGALLSAGSGTPGKDEQKAKNHEPLLGPEAFAGIADAAERSAAMFTEAAKVLTHPRCVNCHPDGNRPRQGEDSHLHEPFVRRGPEGRGAPGLECSTCHTTANFNPVGIPGAQNWHLAPLDFAWYGKTIADICEQIKDPARNGARTLEDIHTHLINDPLVTWGWNPDSGRHSAPGTQDIFVALIRGWIDDGAVCPAP